jgi:predicted porin
MKKTLIALAAIAAVSSAMADVTISGYVDRGYTSVTNTNALKNLTTISSDAGTTGIFFKGNEKLTSDLTGMFQVETDFLDNAGATQATTTAANSQAAGFANGEVFLGLQSASMGTLKLGAPNSFMLSSVTSVGSPSFGTGIGSAYSQTAFGIFNGYGTGGSSTAPANIVAAQTTPNSTGTADSIKTVNAGVRDIRIANTIQIQSPDFSGLKVGIGFTPQNNNVTSTSAYTNTANTSSTAAMAGVGNTVGATEYNLRYTNASAGIDAVYDTIKYTVGSNGAQTVVAALSSAPQTFITSGVTYQVTGQALSTALNGNQTVTHNFIGATYQAMPTLKLHAGYGTTTSGDNTYQTRSNQVGATYTMGQWELLGQTVQVNDGASTGTNRTLQALGANYNFSKTTRAYARYETVNFASNLTAFNGSQQTRSAIGLSMNF